MKSEFEFINDLKSRFSLDKVGDDCAVLPKDGKTDLLVTADLLVEEIDFRLEWTTPEFLGHKALAVSLSDIAAMGGTPKWALLSIGVPENLWKTDFLDQFYAGWHKLARKYKVELVGGDVSRSPDKLIIDSIVGGEIPRGRALFRSGAKPGDSIFVTGYIGGAAAGLALLENGQRFDDKISAPVRHLLFRQLQPLPQIMTGKLLSQYKLPTAMIDLSDGLSSDLSHLAVASNAGARIHAERIPIDPAIGGALEPSSKSMQFALNGGEDFELLLTVAKDRYSVAADMGFHEIGEVTATTGVVELITNGITEILQPKGYDHFAET
jgi:thiamine-monophosphate kinase